MAHGKFATAINCMDGRTQLPVMEFIRKKYGVDYVDTITEPGPNKILADSILNQMIVDNIRKRVEISVKNHGSKLIAIVGHHGCAGNPSPRDVQLNQLRYAANTVRQWNMGAEIICLWVDEKWKASQVEIK